MSKVNEHVAQLLGLLMGDNYNEVPPMPAPAYDGYSVQDLSNDLGGVQGKSADSELDPNAAIDLSGDPALAAGKAAFAAGFRGEALVNIIAIAGRESSYDPSAMGDLKLQTGTWGPSVGLFQIRTLKGDTGKGTSRDISRLQGNMMEQAKAAYELSGGGTDFGPWRLHGGGFLDNTDVGSARRIAQLIEQGGSMPDPHWDEIATAFKLYPTAITALLGMPGIADVLGKAVREGWNGNELQNALMQTDYWKHTSDAQRQWDILQATDPATAQQRWDAGFKHLVDLRWKIGAKLTEPEFQYMAAAAIKNNWSDDTFVDVMLGVHQGGPLPAGGDLGAAITQIKGLASDYGVNISKGEMLHSAKALLMGEQDAQGIADGFRSWAVSAYGNNTAVVDALNRGVTVRQYADPYIQTAVNELGINSADVDFRDAKWSKFLTDVDPETKAGMTLQQWTRTIRTDPGYGYNETAGAADQAAKLTQELARQFGATG